MTRPDDIQAERDHAQTVTLLRRVLGAQSHAGDPDYQAKVFASIERDVARKQRARRARIAIYVLAWPLGALLAWLLLSGCSSPVSTNTALILGGFGTAGVVVGWLAYRKIWIALSCLPGRRPERRGKGGR